LANVEIQSSWRETLTFSEFTQQERHIFDMEYATVMQSWFPYERGTTGLLNNTPRAAPPTTDRSRILMEIMNLVPEAEIEEPTVEHPENVNPTLLNPFKRAFERHHGELLMCAQVAKHEIEGAGSFGGMSARCGFGMQSIRPGHIAPHLFGGSFASNLAGQTPGNWYGLWHSGGSGDAYNANPLFMRREFCPVIIGFYDAGGMVDEIQFELDGYPYPIYDVSSVHTSIPFYELNTPIFIRPRVQYRFRMKLNSGAGYFDFRPIGLTFATASVMRNTNPTPPSVVAP